MKCPKCNSKIKKEYKYCYSCGINVKEYNENKRLMSDIKVTIFFAIISMTLITGYPAVEYFKETTNFVALKSLFSSNSIETISCNDKNDDYVVDYNLNYKNKILKDYTIDYEFKSALKYNEYKIKLAKFSFETGITISVNDETNQISYAVEPISVVNDEIYDFNEIKLDYNEMLANRKCK